MTTGKAACILSTILAISLRAQAPQATSVLSFGVITDIQYRDADPQGTRFYRNSLGKLRAAVEHLNTLNHRFSRSPHRHRHIRILAGLVTGSGG